MNYRLVLLLVCSLVPAIALGQSDNDVEADVGASALGMPMPGMNVNIQVKDGSRRNHREASAHEEQSGDGFRIIWDSDPEGGTWFKVLSPEGYGVKVLDDNNFPVSTGTVPVSFRASGKKYYQVEVRTPGGIFVKKFEAKFGMVAQLWLSPPSAPMREVAPPQVAGPCGSESDLSQVSSAIEGESFSAGKLRVLEDAAQARGFCVEHTVRLLKLFDFEGDKLTALKLLAPRLTDRQNKFKVYQAFEFDSGRDQAKKILR